MTIRKVNGLTVDSDTLDGENPAAFENAGVAAGLITTHTTANAHHVAFVAADADGKITTHETGAKHRWTDEKLLKGAGAGADPDEVAISTLEAAGVAAGLIATHAGLLTGVHGLIVARKSADQIVNDSVTLVNDNHLLFAVGVSEVWEFELLLRMTSPSATPDLDFAFAIPTNGALYAHTYNDGLADSNQEPDGTSETTLAISSEAYYHNRKCLYVGGNTAGNVQLQWAQHVATVENTKMAINSYIVARRLA